MPSEIVDAEKKWVYMKTGYLLFIDIKEAYDSVRREVLYSILLEVGVSMKLVRLMEMCLNERYKKVRVCKWLIIFLYTFSKTRR
jgi:hypothetical protein